jgi:hypothetical protein
MVIFITNKFGLFNSLNKLINSKSPYLFWGCAILICLLLAYNTINNLIYPGEGTSLFRNLNPLLGILGFFIYTIMNILIATMSINISAILIVLFIWMHSLFGIALYNKHGISGIFNEINNINSFIKKDYDDLSNKYCDSLDWFNQFVMYIVKLLNNNHIIVGLSIIFLINLSAVKFHSLYVRLITIVLIMIIFIPVKFLLYQ